MSHLIKQFASNLNSRSRYKPGESTSSGPGRVVGDSYRTNEGQSMTNNYAAGTFTLLICSCMLGAGLFLGSDVNAAQYSLTLSIDNPAPTVNVSPTATGAFAKSEATTISASTTNATGYTLGIKATSGTNYDKLIGASSNLASISEATTEEQFKALNATSYNNQWGYLPSKLNSEANTSFLPAPNTTGSTLEETEQANSTANTYTLELGARVDTSTSIGTYSNTYIVTLVGNAVPYTITYIDNTVANFPVDVSDKTSDSTVNISSNTPTRDGYTFLGWCSTTPTINTNGTDTCSGTTYQPGASLTIGQTSTSNNFNLYAMWSGNYTVTAMTSGGNTLYMQDFNTMSADKKAKIIASMVVGTAYTVKDNRDQAQYKIAKLKDGNIWMLDNLRLGSSSTTALTPTNTNIDKDYTLPASSTTGFTTYTDAKINASYKDTVATNRYGQGSGKIGVYYNYCALSAGTYCYAGGSGVDVADTIVDSPQDICPAGWRLPTGGTTGDFQNLYSYYSTTQTASDTNSLQYNLSIPFAGAYYDSGQVYYPDEGWFPTSTYYTGYSMYRLLVKSGDVSPANYYYRDYGWTVRCLVR